MVWSNLFEGQNIADTNYLHVPALNYTPIEPQEAREMQYLLFGTNVYYSYEYLL